MPTAEQRDEVLKAADEVRRTKAAYEVALARFDAMLDGRSVDTVGHVQEKRKGKVPDPGSINQRVLWLLTNAGPKSIDEMAKTTNATARQVRHAVVYHQKKGRVVHVGPGTYDAKGRMNVNGASAA